MWGRDKNFQVLMLYEMRNRENKKYHNFLAYQEQQQHPNDHGLACQEQNTDQGIGTVLICL